MANGVDDLTTRVQVVEEKLDRVGTALDQLAVSVDDRFSVVDERFNGVDAAIREQREYTEFAFSQLEARLSAKMEAGLGRVDAKMDTGFGRIERRLDHIVDALLPRRGTKKR